jgi:membrane fusion protein (multidrug efflux system)
MPDDARPVALEPDARPDAAEIDDRSFVDHPSAGDRRASRARRRRILRWLLFLLLPVMLIVAGYFYATGGAYMTSDDAYIEADQVGLSTDVSGLVKEVDVTDNQHVTAGQVLFRLDPAPFQYKLDQAQAQLGMVRDNLNALKSNYDQVQAQIRQAQDQIAFDELQFRRQQILARQQVSPRTALDQARLNLQTAQQQLAQLQNQAASIAAQLDGNPDIPIGKQPQYVQALAQHDEAARELRDSVVRAPFAGVVTNVPQLEPGMYLTTGTTAFYLVDTDHVWVEAQPKETELTYVRPGERAKVTIDTYPGRTWHGAVASIGPASQSQFSLLPAENTSGNWVKIVQRIPMRVKIDTGDKTKPPLRSGMSAEVSVYTGHERGLPHFLTSLV